MPPLLTPPCPPPPPTLPAAAPTRAALPRPRTLQCSVPLTGCGVSPGRLGAQRRIVGGDEAGFGSFPWQVRTSSTAHYVYFLFFFNLQFPCIFCVVRVLFHYKNKPPLLSLSSGVHPDRVLALRGVPGEPLPRRHRRPLRRQVGTATPLASEFPSLNL